MPRARAHPLAPVAAALALAAGCGEPERTARSSDARANVTLDDFLLDPQRLSVPAGRVRITVANRGRIGHTLRLRRNGRLWVEVRTQLPGEQARIERTLPKGSYRMFCAIANHEELGMFGTLVAR